MNTKMLTGIIGAALLLSPLTFAQDDQKPSPTSPPSRTRSAEGKRSGMSDDVRQAIAWERAKDRAAARQERIDSRHSSDRNADRTADQTTDDRDPGRKVDPGRRVKDTKAPGARQDK